MHVPKAREALKFKAMAVAAAVAVLGWSGVFADASQSESQQRPYTEDFNIGACTFSPNGANTYFSLEPGHQLILAGEEDKEEVEVIITVLPDTEQILVDGVGPITTRVVEERESADGFLVEVSRNFFALCEETGSVLYFGEDVTVYDEEGNETHPGQWRVGLNGAQPGVVMPGQFLLGSRYFQERAPEVAMDRAENVAMNLTTETSAGTFEKSVMVFETSALASSDRSVKIYAPNVGLIADDTLRLVEWHPAP